MTGTRRLAAAVTREGDGYVAQCIEVDVASQGDTVESALASLTEALELFFEDAPDSPIVAPAIIAPVEVRTGAPPKGRSNGEARVLLRTPCAPRVGPQLGRRASVPVVKLSDEDLARRLARADQILVTLRRCTRDMRSLAGALREQKEHAHGPRRPGRGRSAGR